MNTNTFQNIYYTYLALSIIIHSGFLIFMVQKLKVIRKASNKDLLKAAQWCLFIVSWSCGILQNLLFGANQENTLSYQRIFFIDIVFLNLFNKSNSLTWSVLLEHMKGYYKMSIHNLNYPDVKAKLRKMEKCIFVTCLFYLIILLPIAISGAVAGGALNCLYIEGYELKWVGDQPWITINKVCYALTNAYACSMGFVMGFEARIYFRFLRTLKKWLHKRYLQEKKRIRLLLIISLIWLFLYLALIIASALLFPDLSIIRLESYYGPNGIKVICFFITDLLSNIAIGAYAVYSIQNVNFKVYLCYLLYGNRILITNQSPSIFLSTKDLITEEFEHIEESSSFIRNNQFEEFEEEKFQRQALAENPEFAGYNNDHQIYEEERANARLLR